MEHPGEGVVKKQASKRGEEGGKKGERKKDGIEQMGSIKLA